MVTKYVGKLMLCSKESRKTFKIQNNSIYKFQFIQCVQYFDTNMAKKWTHVLPVSPQNYD